MAVSATYTPPSDRVFISEEIDFTSGTAVPILSVQGVFVITAITVVVTDIIAGSTKPTISIGTNGSSYDNISRTIKPELRKLATFAGVVALNAVNTGGKIYAITVPGDSQMMTGKIIIQGSYVET